MSVIRNKDVCARQINSCGCIDVSCIRPSRHTHSTFFVSFEAGEGMMMCVGGWNEWVAAISSAGPISPGAISYYLNGDKSCKEYLSFHL